MPRGEPTSFDGRYFRPRPYTAHRIFSAVNAALRRCDVVPRGDTLSDAQIAVFRAAYTAPRGTLSTHKDLRRVSVENFLDAYVGDKVSTLQPWRVSPMWTFFYFVEKMYRKRDAETCAMWRSFVKKEIPGHVAVTSFLRRFLIVGYAGPLNYDRARAFRRTMASAVCRGEIDCIVSAGGHFYGKSEGQLVEASMRRSFTLLVFPEYADLLVVDTPQRSDISYDVRVVLERLDASVIASAASQDVSDSSVMDIHECCTDEDICAGTSIHDVSTKEEDGSDDTYVSNDVDVVFEQPSNTNQAVADSCDGGFSAAKDNEMSLDTDKDSVTQPDAQTNVLQTGSIIVETGVKGDPAVPTVSDVWTAAFRESTDTARCLSGEDGALVVYTFGPQEPSTLLQCIRLHLEGAHFKTTWHRAITGEGYSRIERIVRVVGSCPLKGNTVWSSDTPDTLMILPDPDPAQSLGSTNCVCPIELRNTSQSSSDAETPEGQSFQPMQIVIVDDVVDHPPWPARILQIMETRCLVLFINDNSGGFSGIHEVGTEVIRPYNMTTAHNVLQRVAAVDDLGVQTAVLIKALQICDKICLTENRPGRFTTK